MDITGKTIWQIAAGNGDQTNYAKSCLADGVIIVGPGNEGPWPECEILMRRHHSARRVGNTRRLAEEMIRGDLVVLRVGTQHVYGVGEIAGDYDWSQRFGSVQGWNLQHFRRVRWLWHQDGSPKTFPVYSLKLGNSVQRLISPAVCHWLESLYISEEAFRRPLPAW